MPLLAADDQGTRVEAAQVLSRIEGVDAQILTDALLPLLAADNQGTRVEAAQNPGTRIQAAQVLKTIDGVDAQILTDALLPLLAADDQGTRIQAARALKTIEGVDAQVVTNAALPLLGADDSWTREQVVDLLSRIGGIDAQVVTETLLPVLSANNPTTRAEAVKALTQVGLSNFIVSRTLREHLATGQPELLVEIASVLFRLRDVMPALQAMIQMLTRQPWAALAACEKLLAGQALLPTDGQALATVVNSQPDDTELERRARQHVFDWLWSSQEESDQQAVQAAYA